MDSSKLLTMRDRGDVDGLMKVLLGSDLSLVKEAADRLAELGAVAAFDPIVDIFIKHRDAKLISGLCLMRLVLHMRRDNGVKPTPEQIAPLLPLAAEADLYTSRSIKEALGEMHDPLYAQVCGIATDADTILKAIQATRDPDPAKCVSATFRLMKVCGFVADAGLRAKIVDRFLEILRMPVSEEFGPARYHATEGLGLMGDARAVDDLCDALRDPGWMIRQEAAIALAEIKDPKAIPFLIEAKNYSGDDATRSTARKALKVFERLGMYQAQS